MPIGNNVTLKDKLIKSTTSTKNKTSNTSNTSNTRIARKKKDTEGTAKMTFYIDPDLLKKLYNFSYWDRLSLTKAFNIALKDGLKGKNTKDRK